MRKERPILFSGPRVRAILAGHMTQARRVMTEQPQPNGTPYRGGLEMVCLNDYLPPSATMLRVGGSRNGHWTSLEEEGGTFAHLCPYGAPGDRLWVRETWASAQKYIVAYRADGECGAWMGDGGGGKIWNRHGGILAAGFHALRDDTWRGASYGLSSFGGRWRPSIHMPRWASRITLEVTEVRVQRLQEISESDAEDEGTAHWVSGQTTFYANARTGFAAMWDAISHNPAYHWDANPWVWALTFSKVA